MKVQVCYIFGHVDSSSFTSHLIFPTTVTYSELKLFPFAVSRALFSPRSSKWKGEKRASRLFSLSPSLSLRAQAQNHFPGTSSSRSFLSPPRHININRKAESSLLQPRDWPTHPTLDSGVISEKFAELGKYLLCSR
jgi:hypothetical protein